MDVNLVAQSNNHLSQLSVCRQQLRQQSPALNASGRFHDTTKHDAE
jgi:hypothetical protein